LLILLLLSQSQSLDQLAKKWRRMSQQAQSKHQQPELDDPMDAENDDSAEPTDTESTGLDGPTGVESTGLMHLEPNQQTRRLPHLERRADMHED
jgi:hypothetical protein